MCGGEELVAIAEVVSTELSRDVAERLEHVGNRDPGLEAEVGAWRPTLVSPVRIGDWPVMNAARPAVQLC